MVDRTDDDITAGGEDADDDEESKMAHLVSIAA
jgi:hypothetical protein